MYRLFQNQIHFFATFTDTSSLPEITANKVFPLPFFPAADCVRPVLPDEMKLSDEALLQSSFPEGTSITLACDLGYNRTSGSGLVKCSGVTWTQPDLICISESPVTMGRYRTTGGLMRLTLDALLFPCCRERLRFPIGTTEHDLRFEQWHQAG